MINLRKLLLAFIAVSSLFCSNVFADGLPGEHYVTQRWRDLFSPYSPSINPAFMTEENYTTGRFAISPTVHTAFILMEGGVVVPIGLYKSIGATWIFSSPTEDIESTEWDPNTGAIVNTGQNLDANQNLVILSYATNPINRLSLGANANIYFEGNFGDNVFGLAIDAGVSYRLLRHPVLGDHVFGLAFQNIISPDFTAEEISATNYAANLKVSWHGRFWEDRIFSGIDLDFKDFIGQGEAFAASAAATASGEEEDFEADPEFDFNYRLGFWVFRIIKGYFQVGNDYIGGSIGGNVPVANRGRDFEVMYQYLAMYDEKGGDANSHTVYWRMNFGLHREEIYARKMARKINVNPGDLYNKARSLYSAGKYWDAFYIFGQIITEYPEFFKNDWVQYFLGACQEQMDMRKKGIENFKRTKSEFPKSGVVPYADLGIMRIHYKNDNTSGVAQQFTKLNKSTVPDSLKYHAFYLMGETRLKDGDYSKAIQLFELIPSNHPTYIFAQHSRGIAYALNNNVELSLDAFENCISSQAKTREHEEIQNRTFTFLGYIYFEGLGNQTPSLSKAVSALRKVPDDSYYYEDALLGLIWSGIKAHQWADTKGAINNLKRTTDKKPVLAEAALLEGYVALAEGNYQKCADILSPVSRMLDTLDAPSQEELDSRKSTYKNTRDEYQELATKANNLALTTQSSYVQTQIDSLRPNQEEMREDIKNYYLFQDKYERRSFFARNIDKIKEDVDYTLAKAKEMGATAKAIDAAQEAQEEAQELEKEQEELRKQLEQLQQESE